LSTNLNGRLQQRLQGLDDPRIFGFDLRAEAACNAPVSADQELLEIPPDVASLAESSAASLRME
jgi:hypothetical protein